MSILFEVVDLNCQQADNSFFVPQISLSAKSTSSFATVYGWSEFANPSTPPKKYRTITVTGFSRRIGFTAEATPQQAAGAKYVWSGVGQVDFKGNLIQHYSKNFYAQCNKQYWPPEPLQSLPGAIYSDPHFPHAFVGYCWSNDPNSCATCDPNEANWPFLGNRASNALVFDSAGFMSNPNAAVITKTSWSINDVFQGTTAISTMPFTGVLFGTDLDNYVVTVGATTYTGRAAVTTPNPLNFPAEFLKSSGGDFTIGQYINFTDTNNYSAVLSDEYTDADALAHADIVTGTGRTAQNLPRTTGFTSITTSVVFTLFCSNLISGRDYVVTVDFWSQDAFDDTLNSHVTKSYGFTASGTAHTITDVVPTPPANQVITVQKPTIAFV